MITSSDTHWVSVTQIDDITWEVDAEGPIDFLKIDVFGVPLDEGGDVIYSFAIQRSS